MRQRLSLLIAAAAGTAGLAFAAPAQADPPGANGTVKIDGLAFQVDNRNEPHVTCEFQVEFFDFDQGERADIVFSAQPPSGRFVEVGRLDDVEVSDDPATGGSVTRDPDNTFAFSADDLDLAGVASHPKQGYHVKLTVDRHNHPGWTEKHKVFWLRPCASETTPPPPGGSTPPGGNGGGGNGGGGDGGGGLPVTGAPVLGLVALGAALTAGGAGLLFVRRRREETLDG